jgi:hypothetical protein
VNLALRAVGIGFLADEESTRSQPDSIPHALVRSYGFVRYLRNLAKLFPAALPLVGVWRRPHQRAEGGGEIALGGKAQLLAHVRDPAPGIGQEVFGPLHPLVEQILMRAQPGALLEEAAEVGGGGRRCPCATVRWCVVPTGLVGSCRQTGGVRTLAAGAPLFR